MGRIGNGITLGRHIPRGTDAGLKGGFCEETTPQTLESGKHSSSRGGKTVAPRNDTRRDGFVGTPTTQRVSTPAHSGRFVLDFAAPKCLLAIEVDGSIHAGRELEDEERQRILESQGWRFLRFPNAEIQDNLPAVLNRSHPATASPLLPRIIWDKMSMLATNKTSHSPQTTP